MNNTFEMKKDFEGWNEKKKKLHSKQSNLFYHEREIWWCSLGVNIGFEQDGTGKNFDRPIIVIRGFNKNIFFELLDSVRARSRGFLREKRKGSPSMVIQSKSTRGNKFFEIVI